MGDGIVGKILYFWIFIFGGLFVGKITGVARDDRSLIVFLAAIAAVYIVWQVAKGIRNSRR